MPARDDRSTDARGKPSVAVCVITYQRPKGLERVLRGLDGLVFTRSVEPDIQVIVVDNDPGGTGIAVCERVRACFRWPLVAEIEPRRGIPFARNRALALASGVAEFIAFIDDDAEPDAHWLDELLRTQAEYGAEIVRGAVLPRFAVPPAPWIRHGRFFERARFPTGTRVRDAATGNVLFRAELPERLQIRFSEAMALTGGSDTLFFRQLSRAGASIVFANEAIVYEWVPPTRANAGWLLRREFRFGNVLAVIDREIGSTSGALIRLAKGLRRVVLGLSALPLAILAGRQARIAAFRGLKGISRGLGMLAGLWGIRYMEYKRTHGE